MPRTTRLQKKIARGRAKAAGPVFVGQILSSVVEDDEGGKHEIVFFPDKNNPELRRAGLAQHYYFLPQSNRLAKRSDGSYIFQVQRFSGIMDPSKNIGENGYSELAGGYSTFTATMAPPPGVIERAFEAVKSDLESTRNDYYRWKRSAPIVASPAPIALRSNRTVLHSLNYSGLGQDGDTGGNNPDAWAFEIQGAGEGTLNTMSTNAFTVMMGRRPIELIWAGAKTGSSPLTLENHISYDVWTVPYKLTVQGDWEKIREHFSASASGQLSWLKTDAATEVNELIENGAVTVDIELGAGLTMEDKEKLNLAADQVITLVLNQVMEKLKHENTTLEDEVQAASATAATEEVKRKSKILGFISIIEKFKVGVGFAIKHRRDSFSGTFSVTKNVEEQVTRSEVVSAQMEGLFNELKTDETALDRYFSEVFFEEGFRKIHVVASAVANWPENGVGDPIHEVKLQVGYPDSNGRMNWKAHARVLEDANDTDPSNVTLPAVWRSDNKGQRFVFDFTRHEHGDDSEAICLRETIVFKENPDVAVNSVSRESDGIEEHSITVRAESLGMLSVGPIMLDMPISQEDNQIDVIVTLKTERFGEKKFRFDGASAPGERFYKVWYESPGDIETYKYFVDVSVRGRRFGQRPLKWSSEDWTEGSGSGPLTVEIPPAPDEYSDLLDEYLSD